MSASYVTLEHAGTEQTLGEWGIAQGSTWRTHSDQEPDTFTCLVPILTISDAPLFAWLDKVTVRRDRTKSGNTFTGGSIVFVGYRTEDCPIEVDGPQYFQRYTFANAWKWIAETQYQQTRCTSATNIGGTITRTYGLTSDVILGMEFGESGETVKLTSGQQLSAILTYALAQLTTYLGAAPFQIGTIESNMDIPIKQVAELSCAAAIQECLRLQPDASVAWDYFTSPPTIHIYTTGGTSVSLALSGTEWQGLSIRSHPELRCRAAIIRYKIAGFSFSTDKWGTNDFTTNPDGAVDTGPDGGPQVVCITQDLAPATLGTYSARLDAETVNCNASGNTARRAWWGMFHPELLSTKIRFQTAAGVQSSIPNATITARGDQYDADGNLLFADGDEVSLAAYPRMLTRRNAVMPWMQYNGGDVQAIDVNITVADVEEREYLSESESENPDADTSGQLIAARKRNLHAAVTLTNADTGLYTGGANVVSESPPTGVAKAIFDSCKELQYSGEDVRVDPATPVTLLNSLNLTGGRSEWATMEATIRQIRFNDSTDERTISFGPRAHLDAPTLLALARWNRENRTDVSIGERASGLLATEIGL